jgi:hypothetical protein
MRIGTSDDIQSALHKKEKDRSLGAEELHCEKGNDFPVPSWDVTNQTLTGREKLNYSRKGRVWLVTSGLRAVESRTFFYSLREIYFQSERT